MTDAILFLWTEDEVMKPANGFWQKKAIERFAIGGHYTLAEIEERSSASHRHYFSALHDAWVNLPEHLAEQFPSVEKLRKTALIRTGFANSQTFVCASRAEALRMAAFIQPIDEYSIIEANGATITRWTAKSQSTRAMPKGEFQRLKEAVLGWVSDLIGTTAKALQENAAA